ncbi:MAG: paraquat-inducible protein A [Acetobacteraceae bacterium]
MNPAQRRVATPAPPRLRECPDCGQFQVVPELPPATRAQCLRCDAVLRHTHSDPLWTPLALNVTALLLFLIAAGSTLMLVSTAGQVHIADMFSGPIGLDRHGMWELAAVVLFTTIAAPAIKLCCMLYVLIGLRTARPPANIRTVFAWVEHLRPWSMIEVYLLGVFVAYVKLGDLVYIQVGVALYALGALLLTMIAADAMLDAQFVWEEMERRGVARLPVEHVSVTAARSANRMIGCDTCGLVSHPTANCPRCGFRLHDRKPDSLVRTWALGAAAAILYVPANIYPVLTVVQLGAGQPSTILGGVRELLTGGQWPLAALVFFASVMVPVLKLVGLTVLLTSTQQRRVGRLRDRTRLYRIVDAIGRWSMIDIFMASLLVALVQFGALVTIDPGTGAIAFAGVVILTMFAARTFDPRLMWDAAAARAR